MPSTILDNVKKILIKAVITIVQLILVLTALVWKHSYVQKKCLPPLISEREIKMVTCAKCKDRTEDNMFCLRQESAQTSL